jgi:hypothetical protein
MPAPANALGSAHALGSALARSGRRSRAVDRRLID